MGLSPVGVALIGILIERFALRRLYSRDPMLGLLFTFGLALTAEQSLRMIWGTTGLPFSLPEQLRGQLILSDFIYSYYRLFVLAVAITAVSGCWLLLNKTAFGMVVRAGVRDWGGARGPGGRSLGPARRRATRDGHRNPHRNFRRGSDRRIGQFLGRGHFRLAGRCRARHHRLLLPARGRSLDVPADGADPAVPPARTDGREIREVRMKPGNFLRHPFVISAVALLALPHVVNGTGFTWAIATEIAIFALVGLGYNLLLGYTGLLSFGHGMFFGLAAYATALSQMHWFKGSLWLPLGFAVLFSAAFGLIVGFLVLRRRGVYFSLLTLAFTALTFYIVYRWTSFTGGENGLSGIERAPF